MKIAIFKTAILIIVCLSLLAPGCGCSRPETEGDKIVKKDALKRQEESRTRETDGKETESAESRRKGLKGIDEVAPADRLTDDKERNNRNNVSRGLLAETAKHEYKNAPTNLGKGKGNDPSALPLTQMDVNGLSGGGGDGGMTVQIAAQKGEGDASTPEPPERKHFAFKSPGKPLGSFEMAAKGGPGAGASRPFWVVEKFAEKADWLGTQPHIAELKREWGVELTQAVRKKLLMRSLTVESVGRKLTKEEVRQLATEGMKYLCGGTLETLASAEVDGKRSADLVVVYELKRSSGSKVRLVQKKRLRITRGIAGKSISQGDLEALIDTAAETIAGRIVEHIPSDLAASRG